MTELRIGDGQDPNAGVTQNVPFLVSTNRTNPDAVIEQHSAGFAFYSGTPGDGCGTLQGGSSEAFAYANGTRDMDTVLGFEGIGRSDGSHDRRVNTVIGMMGSVITGGAVKVGMLVGLRARGPLSEGSGEVEEARSLDIQEPLTGRIRRSLFSVGVHRFRQGRSTNVLEVTDRQDREVFTVDGRGLILVSPNGTRFRVAVSDDGTISTNSL